MEFAVHMQNKKTGKRRIKKVNAENVDVATCKDFYHGSEWSWTGSEPFKNVNGEVKHIGGGYYERV